MIEYRTLRRPMVAALITFGLVVASGDATATEERWTCCEGSYCNPGRDETVVTLTANPTNNTGIINLDNMIVRKTDFRTHATHGLYRYWFWANDGQDYFIKMGASRIATFYKGVARPKYMGEGPENLGSFSCGKR